MRVLVTRAKEDAVETAALLKERGHEPFVVSLSEIRFRHGPEIATGDVAAILVTSANGIRGFARRTPRRDVRIIAAGERTAGVARELSFINVASAEGDAATLAMLVRKLVPAKSALLHAKGGNASDELERDLVADYRLRSEVVYDIIYTTSFPDAISDGLRAGTIDAVLFFSRGNAQAFSDLVRATGLDASCDMVTAICISARAASGLNSLRFADVKIATHPDGKNLLALLDP